MENEQNLDDINQFPPAFSDQKFTSTDVSKHLGIVRREVHENIKQPQSELSPTMVPHGKSEKYIFDWDDYQKLSKTSKRKKKINKKVKTFSMAKGGVGKTAIATALIHEACYRGYKVLAIDLDPQGHFTYNLGIPDYNGRTFKDILLPNGQIKDHALSEIIIPITPLLHIIPSCINLNGIELILKNKLRNSEFVLKEAIAPLLDEYDIVIIDTNPYVSLTFVNAIMASDHILIPVLTDFNSHMGLDYMTKIMNELFSSKENWPLISVIPNGYDVRNNICKESINAMRENFSSFLTEAKVRLSTDISQSHKLQQSLYQYKKSSKVYSDIQELAEEIFQ